MNLRIKYVCAPLVTLFTIALVACGCKSKNAPADDEAAKKPEIQAPDFNADSAYLFVKAQVDFGPRVTGTAPHKACGDYLAQKLAEFGAKVTNQYADVTTYEGKLLKARNIIGAYKPEHKKRIALFAHWDSRPWADNDPDPSNHYKPIPGANDGASGVGVLLEIARQIQAREPTLGIDLILLDAEDQGTHQDYDGQHSEESWCLGAQYWARNPHVDGYSARFGILLDMVGAKNTVFRYEYVSEQHAKNVNRKVWNAAEKLGYGHYFRKEEGGGATDDHVFINRYARIPTIDIVASSEQYSFFEHWHTVRDDMDAIDRSTLKAVGQTVLQVIYNEQ